MPLSVEKMHHSTSHLQKSFLKCRVFSMRISICTIMILVPVYAVWIKPAPFSYPEDIKRRGTDFNQTATCRIPYSNCKKHTSLAKYSI